MSLLQNHQFPFTALSHLTTRVRQKDTHCLCQLVPHALASGAREGWSGKVLQGGKVFLSGIPFPSSLAVLTGKSCHSPITSLSAGYDLHGYCFVLSSLLVFLLGQGENL